ncbi:hypothetical protein GOBAR_DD30134 [Gossypium barbadense]|nr:hypothetical protein GOBAR_DD30134 [Gossypium barbadense]
MIVRSEPTWTYLVNISIFTSISDFWSVARIFPIVPIYRLDLMPEVKAILSDFTCGSDGKIDKFIGVETSLPLHKPVLQSNNPHSFAITRAKLGPSYAYVLRVMQHEPELMFETLKHRAEEFCNIDDDTSLANTVGRSFHNMPYLKSGSSRSLTAMNNSVFYYCNEEDYYAGSETGANADEHWSYCFA